MADDRSRLPVHPTFSQGLRTTEFTSLHEHTQVHRATAEAEFLSFVHILSELRIPNVNSCILNAGTVLATSGTLGQGAQYLVDRIYENQRSVAPPLPT